tara:strand:- start:509 stop:1174 length:666 start_codon:yes stop_codon:yes gene_type:complete
MKRWAQRDATTGGTLSPDAINDELRAQQSSITTLDRDQLPEAYVTESRLKDYGILRGYIAAAHPTGGQQNTVVYAPAGSSNTWDAVAFRVYPGGWQNASSGAAVTLAGFKGGHLHIEWAGNAYIFGSMAAGASIPHPLSPRYLNLRIIANGVVIAEKRGPGCHEAFRVIGSSLAPQGDITLRFQWRISGPSQDDATVTTAGMPVTQAHLYSMRYLAIGRWR